MIVTEHKNQNEKKEMSVRGTLREAELRKLGVQKHSIGSASNLIRFENAKGLFTITQRKFAFKRRVRFTKMKTRNYFIQLSSLLR